MRNRLGLYVHVPFCAAICNYCNFNRGLFDADAEGAVRRRARRARSARGVDGGAARAADTIFFGGGTPSLLEPEEIARLVAACRDGVRPWRPTREVTLEANPETVTRGPARARSGAAGVNRAQLRRAVVPRRGIAPAVAAAQRRPRARGASARRARAGFDNVSLDLMMWLPGQQRRATGSSRSMRPIALEPEHLSLYLLELYPNAPLKDDMARARLVAGARRRRGGDVPGGDGAAGRGRVSRSTRSRTSRGRAGGRGTT